MNTAACWLESFTRATYCKLLLLVTTTTAVRLQLFHHYLKITTTSTVTTTIITTTVTTTTEVTNTITTIATANCNLRTCHLILILQHQYLHGCTVLLDNNNITL